MNAAVEAVSSHADRCVRDMEISRRLSTKAVEIVLLIILKLFYMVLDNSEVGEKLQRVALRGEIVDRNIVVETLQSSSLIA